MNAEWLDHLCRALVEHCVESTTLVSHHHWHEDDGGWQIEMFPALMLDAQGEVAYDLSVSIDIHEMLQIVEKITFLQCSAEKITMCASFVGNEFKFEFLFEPPEDAEIAGSMDENGTVTPTQPEVPEGPPD